MRFAAILNASICVAAMCAGGPCAGAQEPAATAPFYRETGDWIAACDNTRACFAKAKGLPANTGYMTIARDAGPRGHFAVSIEFVDRERLAAPDAAKFVVDGLPLDSDFDWVASPKESAVRLSNDDAMRFLRFLRERRQLAYSRSANAPRVSLAGLAAVLDAMDEEQGRVGTETALARPGNVSVSAVPPAPAIPAVHAVLAPKPLANGKAFAATVRQVLTFFLKARCQPDMAADGDNAFALNDAEMIAIIGCQRGAFQNSYLVFRAPFGHPESARQIVMPLQPTLSRRQAPADLRGVYQGEVGWDPRRATFYEIARGAAAGNCGTSTDWTYDGHDFAVSEFRRQDFCGGPSGDWPVVYRAHLDTH